MKIIGTNVFSITAMIALMTAGIFMSFNQSNFQWLSRFGALIICVGIMTMARPFITGRPLRIRVIMESGFDVCDKKHYRTVGERHPDWLDHELRDRAAVGWLGPIICFAGTATNGFGDLLNGYFGFT
jgi:hypothetical protein